MKAVNLLPPDSRGVVKTTERTVVVDESSSFGAFAVLGALALAVVAIAGVVLTGNSIKEREAELASTQAQKAQIAGRAAQLKPFADFDQLASERVATVRDLAGRRFDWEQVVRDLSRAIPADVTLTELTGDVSTDTGGGSSSGLRSAIAAPAITVKGCTSSQRDVPGLMARFRNIDGVTRVSLAKSDKVDDGSSAAGAGASVPSGETTMADRRAAPCGTGSKPQFEMVMFFENDAEASTAPSAAPSTAGAPVAATPTPAPGAAAGTTTSTTPAGSATPTATPTTSGGVSP
jgi:Tfp pilus assembly protein PilN